MATARWLQIPSPKGLGHDDDAHWCDRLLAESFAARAQGGLLAGRLAGRCRVLHTAHHLVMVGDHLGRNLLAGPSQAPSTSPGNNGAPGTDLFKGLQPNWGPFSKIGDKARTVIQIIMAAVLMVCFGTAMLGAGKIRVGQSEYSHDPIAVRDGRRLMYGGGIGAFLVASMGTIFTVIYGMGI